MAKQQASDEEWVLVIHQVKWHLRQFLGISNAGDRRTQLHDFSHVDLFLELGQVIRYRGSPPTETMQGKDQVLVFKSGLYDFPKKLPDELIFDVIINSSDFYHIGESRIGPLKEAYADQPKRLLKLLRGVDLDNLEVPDELASLGFKEDSLRRLVIGYHLREWRQQCRALGISLRAAKAYFDVYHWQTVVRFQKNPFSILPYCDVDDFQKLLFKLKDAFPHKPKQAEWASVWVAFYQASQSYRMSIPENELLDEIKKVLKGDYRESLLRELTDAGHLVLLDGHYQLRPIHALESRIAAHIKRLNQRSKDGLPSSLQAVDWPKCFQEIDREDLPADVAIAQLKAFEQGRMLFIYGEAGTGKSWLSSRIIFAFVAAGWAARVVAVSNIAVSRVRQELDPLLSDNKSSQQRVEYSSVQRFLWEKPKQDQPPTLILLDESSMIGSSALLELLARVRPCDRLLMVGDHRQVPPIGWGAVFHILRGNTSLNQIVLSTRMRQRGGGQGILDFLDALNAGKDLVRAAEGKETISVMACDGRLPALKVLENHLRWLTKGQRFELPVILCLSRQDAHQVNQLCRGLRAARRTKEGLNRKKWHFAEFMSGEPVIYTRNVPNINLWNGTRGEIVIHKNLLKAQFGKNNDPIMIDEAVERAYAVTVHRAQGEGHPEVILYLGETDSPKLNHRGTLYTAITRASQKLVIVAQPEIFNQGYARANRADDAHSVSYCDI